MSYNVFTADVLYIIRKCHNPDEYLSIMTTYPHEALGRAYYVELYDDAEIEKDGEVVVDPGNIQERLALHSGSYDIPSPEPEERFHIINEIKRWLRDGEKVYQFVLGDYSYYETFEDKERPSKPDYEEFEEAPDGWLTIAEACEDKDVDKSTVNRAVYNGELRCGFVPSERRRYICPDSDYETWDPGRKKSYLRDRRLIIAAEIINKLNNQELMIFNDKDLYEEIERIEMNRFGDNHIPRPLGGEGMAVFLKDAIGHLPKNLWEWIMHIDDLCENYSLNTYKKLKRAWTDDQLEHIEKAYQKALEEADDSQ